MRSPWVPDTVFEHYDFINIMAYDKTGPWAPNSPGQHSSYEFAVENVAYWLGRGLPKSKLVLGVPFYGHGFGEAAASGGNTYAKILATHPGAEKVDQIGNTIWYNGIPTIRKKAQFVVDEDLGGVMIWAINGDVKGEHSLLSAIHGVVSDQ